MVLPAIPGNPPKSFQHTEITGLVVCLNLVMATHAASVPHPAEMHDFSRSKNTKCMIVSSSPIFLMFRCWEKSRQKASFLSWLVIQEEPDSDDFPSNFMFFCNGNICSYWWPLRTKVDTIWRSVFISTGFFFCKRATMKTKSSKMKPLISQQKLGRFRKTKIHI